MAFSVDFQKMFEVEMGVFLSRRQAFMTEELLDNPQIRSPAQKMGGKRMPEGMGTYLPPHRRTADIFVHYPFY